MLERFLVFNFLSLKGNSSVAAAVSRLTCGTGRMVAKIFQWKNIFNSGEPKVTHGRTGCGWVPLWDVLEEAIKPYAFRVSPYPVEC